MQALVEVLRESLIITAFVFVMMVVVEYLNVLSQGVWKRRLGARPWVQYFLAALLGATPGCLGAYAVVAMFTRGTVSLGAVVAVMVATCGDESFVMLACMPRQALALIGALFCLAILAGFATDLALGRRFISPKEVCDGGEFHADVEECRHFSARRVVAQWRSCSSSRGILAIALGLYFFSLMTGLASFHRHASEAYPSEGVEETRRTSLPLAHDVEHADEGDSSGDWNWIRLTMILASVFGLFIVITVPDHFLEEHLWRHIARRHAPRLFLWTLLALGVTRLLLFQLHSGLDVEASLRDSRWILLLVACLIGLIPASGPHLVFITLFMEGAIPLGVLLANSIVQDGHGMLPLLAHSRRAFFIVKGINFLIGLAVGAFLLSLRL